MYWQGNYKTGEDLQRGQRSMIKITKVCVYVEVLFLLICSACNAVGSRPDPFKQNELLGRGVNLGNALEAPEEGQWGVTLEEEYFKLIKDAGFNSVRIPVRWSAHALKDKPYTIEASFFKRVDWAVEQALSRGFHVILNMHHYEEIYIDPAGHRQRFLALWEQIAAHYKDQSANLLFEFLNEPNKNLKAEPWNQLIEEVLKVVRRSNPYRTVVIGPASWNNIDFLDKLRLPDADRNIIVSCHYYKPFEFTHQGASWVGTSAAKDWIGTQWSGTEKEGQAIIEDFEKARVWAQKNKRPVNIGEFGSYSKADMASRALWTAFIARQAEKKGFSWTYWEFCAGFGVYDRQEKRWNEPLVRALIPPEK